MHPRAQQASNVLVGDWARFAARPLRPAYLRHWVVGAVLHRGEPPKPRRHGRVVRPPCVHGPVARSKPSRGLIWPHRLRGGFRPLSTAQNRGDTLVDSAPRQRLASLPDSPLDHAHRKQVWYYLAVLVPVRCPRTVIDQLDDRAAHTVLPPGRSGPRRRRADARAPALAAPSTRCRVPQYRRSAVPTAAPGRQPPRPRNRCVGSSHRDCDSTCRHTRRRPPRCMQPSPVQCLVGTSPVRVWQARHQGDGGVASGSLVFLSVEIGLICSSTSSTSCPRRAHILPTVTDNSGDLL